MNTKVTQENYTLRNSSAYTIEHNYFGTARWWNLFLTSRQCYFDTVPLKIHGA